MVGEVIALWQRAGEGIAQVNIAADRDTPPMADQCTEEEITVPYIPARAPAMYIPTDVLAEHVLAAAAPADMMATNRL